MRNTNARKLATALAGVAALVLGSSALVASPALAAPGEGGDATLTVHKLEQPEGGNIGPNDGSELQPSGAAPLEAGFTTCTIDDINLASPSDWERLKDLTVTVDASGAPIVTENGTELALSCGTEQFTSAADGQTVFTLPADRAYVVFESTPAANAIPAAYPTIVTLPFPGSGAPGQPTWNYNPHIYPKNSVVGGGATKNGTVVGDSIVWDVNVPIQRLAEGQSYSELRINDQLASFVKYTGGEVAMSGADGADVPLTAGTDYTLTAPSGATGDEVVLTMLAPGLAKVEANIGGKLVLTIRAQAVGTGDTSTEAQITINGTSTDPGTGPEVIDPKEFFAGAHILKEAKNKGASSNVPLAGATFDIYSAAQGTTDCPADPDPAATQVVSATKSGADGKTPSQVLAQGAYCVYEPGVPAGYKGLNGGMLLTVDGDDSSVTVVNTQVGADEGDLPALPITGAQGTVLLLVAGGALILVAAVLLAARRKAAQK